MEIRTDEHKCVMNITPEADFFIEPDDSSYRSIAFSLADKYLLAPSLSNSKAQIFSVSLPAPPLKHLCRLAIRKVITNSADLHRLNLPSRLLSYLSYNTFR